MPNNSPQAQATPARTKAKAVFAPLSVVERLVSAFVLTSASVLCILSVFYPGLLFTAVNPGTAEKPQMTYPGALSLFGVLLGILLFFALLSALHWFRPEWEGEKWGTFAGAFVLFFVALTQVCSPYVYLAFCAVLLGACVYAQSALARAGQALSAALPQGRARRWACMAVAGAAGLGFCLYIGVCTVAKVRALYMPNFDFGIFAQMFATMRRTGLPDTTVERNALLSHFGVHFSPVYYLWLPFYALFPYGETLAVLQVLTLASAAVPLWRLGGRYGLSDPVRAGLCALLLLYPAFGGGCFYSVHENKFLLPLLLWLLCFLEEDKLLPAAAFALLTLCVKEDAAVYVAFLALYLLLRAAREKSLRRAAVGAGLLVLSVGWFLMAVQIVSALGTEGVMEWRYGNFDYNNSGSLITVIKACILDPLLVFSESFTAAKFPFVLFTLLPLALLPLLTRKWERLVLLGPYLLMHLMGSWQYQYSIFFQYTYGSCALLFFLCVMNLADFTPGRRRRGVAMALLCSCLLFAGTIRDGGTDTVWTISTGYYVKDAVQNRTEYDRVREVLAQIPRDTGVAASTMFIAPLADCPELYDMDSSYPTGSPSYAYPGNLPESVTYVAIDLRYSNHRERYDNNAEWEKVTESAFVVVYHRK